MTINLRVCRLLLAWGLTAGASAYAQSPAATDNHNIAQLSASGTMEAAQDWLTLSLSVTREGSDANAVQVYLRQATESALAKVKASAQAGNMEVHSGAFSLQPRYSNDGKLNGWVGNSELVLEGNDFARISAAATNAQPMTINGLAFSLSRQARTQLEGQAQTLAIQSFKAKAADIARDFGFHDYALREISVSAMDQSTGPRPRMMAMGSRAVMADAPPVPLESGKSLVVVTVSGAIQLK